MLTGILRPPDFSRGASQCRTESFWGFAPTRFPCVGFAAEYVRLSRQFEAGGRSPPLRNQHASNGIMCYCSWRVDRVMPWR